MPRLLPRLLKYLENRPLSKQDYRGSLVESRRRRRRSLWKPPNKAVDAAFSLSGRQQSLLLDQDNIITSPEEHARHKSLPPVVRLQKTQQGILVDHDRPREMTEQERQWWSSPYLRMLSTPIRRCVISNRHIPTDFLVRLVVLKLPPTRFSRDSTTLVPDGLLHPKFTNRIYGGGHYVACWKDAVAALLERASYKKIVRNISVHSLISTQIGHQLRLRVLQELEMLAARLITAPGKLVDDAVIRRLTRSEWARIKSSGHIPWEDAAFVIVVPPANRDVRTGQRPRLDLGSMPPESLDLQPCTLSKELPSLPPVSTLHLTEDPTYEESMNFPKDSHLPHLQVPFYHGLSLFPLPTQRAALHDKLCELLSVERSTRWKQHRHANKDLRSDKPSHAFVVFSNARSVARADSVPLAVALWRVRMWEGAGWGDCSWLTSRRPDTSALEADNKDLAQASSKSS